MQDHAEPSTAPIEPAPEASKRDADASMKSEAAEKCLSAAARAQTACGARADVASEAISSSSSEESNTDSDDESSSEGSDDEDKDYATVTEILKGALHRALYPQSALKAEYEKAQLCFKHDEKLPCNRCERHNYNRARRREERKTRNAEVAARNASRVRRREQQRRADQPAAKRVKADPSSAEAASATPTADGLVAP